MTTAQRLLIEPEVGPARRLGCPTYHPGHPVEPLMVNAFGLKAARQ